MIKLLLFFYLIQLSLLMLNLFSSNPDPSFVFWVALLHCLIGLGSAIVADNKGYSFIKWLGIGLLAGTLGLILSLRLELKSQK